MGYFDFDILLQECVKWEDIRHSCKNSLVFHYYFLKVNESLTSTCLKRETLQRRLSNIVFSATNSHININTLYQIRQTKHMFW